MATDPAADAVPRFPAIARRAFLTRTAALVGVLAVAPVAACSDDDADVLAGTGSADTSSGDAAASTTEAASTGGFPAGGELVVDLTYEASGGGRVENPYIAVWVEDADGALVQTISVWYESGRGERWLGELREWSAVADASATAVTGATRAAGSYSVVWDGSGLDGQPVPAGTYTVLVEAAREHGPYQIVATEVPIADEPVVVDGVPDGELTAVAIRLEV